MKKTIYVACFLTFILTAFTSYAQEYKTVEDTVKLNKEFTEVSNDIANLTAKLTIAQNNLPGYKSKANAAESNAQNAAANSSEQADKARNGSVKEARKAKLTSKKALHKAKDSRSANKDISEQDDKIASLTGHLAEKQIRLDQLAAMRVAINAQSPK